MAPGGAEEGDGVGVGGHDAEEFTVCAPEEGQAGEDESRKSDGCDGAKG